jgi:hypothetical protein
MATRVRIQVHVDDPDGIQPRDWHLPEDVTAEQVMDTLREAGSWPAAAIKQYDLLHRPRIVVTVERGSVTDTAEWAS